MTADRGRHALLERLLADELAQAAARAEITHHTDSTARTEDLMTTNITSTFLMCGGIFVLSFAAIWAFWFVERLRGSECATPVKATEYRGVRYTRVIVDEQGDWQWAVSLGNPKKVKSGQAATKGDGDAGECGRQLIELRQSVRPEGRGEIVLRAECSSAFRKIRWDRRFASGLQRPRSL